MRALRGVFARALRAGSDEVVPHPIAPVLTAAVEPGAGDPRNIITIAQRWLLKDTSSVILATVTLSLVRIVSTMILTRLLDAEVFGIMGILTAINTIFVMSSDIGFYPFVVRHKASSDSKLLDQVWTIRLIRSVVLTCLVVLLSFPMAMYLGKPFLQPAIAVFSVLLLIDGLASMAFATAVRTGEIKKLALLDVVPILVQVPVSVVLVYFFRSYWSIIAAIIIGSVTRSVLSYTIFAESRRCWSFSRTRAREVWRFGRAIAMSSFITLLLAQSDKFVLSPLFPLDLFGLYILASSLVTVPQTLASTYSQRILFPAYAQAYRQAPQTLRAVYRGYGIRMRILFDFGAGLLLGIAPLIIQLLYDPRYMGAALYLRLLSISLLIRLNTAAANQMLIAVGQTRNALEANIVRIGWMGIGGMLAFLKAGPLGLVFVVGTMEIPAYLYMCWKLKRLHILDLRHEALMLCVAGAGAVLGALLSPLAGQFVK